VRASLRGFGAKTNYPNKQPLVERVPDLNFKIGPLLSYNYPPIILILCETTTMDYFLVFFLFNSNESGIKNHYSFFININPPWQINI